MQYVYNCVFVVSVWLQHYPRFPVQTAASAVSAASDSASDSDGGAGDVLDFIMGIYSLERVGIGHDSKEAVRAAARRFSCDDLFDCDAEDFILRATDEADEAGAETHTTDAPPPPMSCRVYTQALTYSFYADKIGIDIRLVRPRSD